MTVNRKAFTLIELLVVVAIIALLVAILVPSLEKARSLSKTVVCANNQRNVAVGFLLYCEASNGVVDRYWWNTMRPFFDKSMDYNILDPDGTYCDDIVGTTSPGLSCPVVEDSEDSGIYNPNDGPCGPYGVNIYATMGDSFDDEMIGSIYTLGPNTCLLTDAYTAYVYAPHRLRLMIDVDGDGIIDSPINAWNQPSTWTFGFFRPRHYGGNSMVGSVDERGANFTFVDGHVEYRTFRQWLDNDSNIWGAV